MKEIRINKKGPKSKVDQETKEKLKPKTKALIGILRIWRGSCIHKENGGH